jgi:membrane protease YdiL (CAAX protease family)
MGVFSMKEKIKFSTVIFGMIGALVIYEIAEQIPDIVCSFLSGVLPAFLVYIINGLLTIVLMYFLLKLFAEKVLKFSMEELNMPKFKVKSTWVTIGFILPILLIGIFFFGCRGEFRILKTDSAAILESFCYDVFPGALTPGFVEEMLCRSFWMTLLTKRFGVKTGVIVPSLIFASMHLFGRSLSPASFLMLMAGGTAVGIMFSMITLAEHSIWNSAIIHSIWDFFMGGILIINLEPERHELFARSLTTKNLLISGGEFGVDVSIISIIAFVIVSWYAYTLIKKKLPESFCIL